jgi:ParB/RepB/Spo0J family partition protein
VSDLELRLDQLVPNPDNPRATLGELDELAASILSMGLLQRLLVSPVAGAVGQFMVVDGHRRYWAMRSIEYPLPIPVEIRVMDRVDMLVAAVAAGSFSRPISPIDQAKAFQALRELGLNQLQISERTGVPQPTVSTRLRLLELSPAQQLAVHEGRMTLDQAKKATHAIRRRAPDRAPRPPRAQQLGVCPTCGTRPAPPPPPGADRMTFAPRARPVVDPSLPPAPPADRTVGGVPGPARVLMCDDCDFSCDLDRVSLLIRHCVEVHGRPATKDERRPARPPHTVAPTEETHR